MFYQNYEDYMQNVLGYRNDMSGMNSMSNMNGGMPNMPNVMNAVPSMPKIMGGMPSMPNAMNVTPSMPNVMNAAPGMPNVMSGMPNMADMDGMNNMPSMPCTNCMDNMNKMNTYNMPERNSSPMIEESNLESMYPEIYRLVNPMVMKVCEENTKPITEETIGEMTKTVYTNFEAEGNIGINVKKELRNGDVINPRSRQQQTVRETRSPSYLNDLIRILIIRNLLRRPMHHHPRPPMPGPGPRPPYPPMPGPGPRPPYMRGNEQGDIDYYNMNY